MASAITQARGDGALICGEKSTGGKKGLVADQTLKAEPTGFAVGWDVVFEKKRKVITDFKDFFLEKLEDGVDIY